MDQQTLENEAINEFDIINENEIITENNSVDGTMAEVKMPSGVAVKYKRQYDIIVFGASGCIGKHVVKAMDYFSQIYGVTWAVAGRSVEKLQYVLDELYKTRGGNDDLKIDIIHADVHDITTVIDMAQIASVVINCTGPYYIYGEVVVKSCIMNSTHYVDISGESLFMEKMAYLYNSEAEKKNALIVSALGLDCVPADLGVEYLFNHFNGELQNVNVYTNLYTPITVAKILRFNFDVIYKTCALFLDGTWISGIHHYASTKKLSYYRALLDESIGLIRTEPESTGILHRQRISAQNKDRSWCVPFAEPEQAVITRSIHHANTVDQLPYNFSIKTYMALDGFLPAILCLFSYISLSIMAKLKPLRILLIQILTIITMGFAFIIGPNKMEKKKTKCTLSVIGHGSSVKPLTTDLKETKDEEKCTRETIVKVTAINPGNGLTSKAVVLGAITILKEQDKIPKGGVLTPAAAFRNSQYMNRLMEHEVVLFEMESDMISYKQHLITE